jgi:hypothetical protein
MSLVESANNISLVLQIVIVLLLVLGLPLTRGQVKGSKNLVRHGYLTVVAVVLHTILVLFVMIYLPIEEYSTILSLPVINAVAVLSHIILGIIALALGYVIVGLWIAKSTGNMYCFKLKTLMLPTLIIWIISLIVGISIHLLELF